MQQQDVREYIRLCMVKRDNISQANLARKMDETPQNLNNKFKRNTFKVDDLEKIANALNADLNISFIDRDTGEPII